MAVTRVLEPRARLPVVDEGARTYEHPLYGRVLTAPGLGVFTAALDRLLEWGLVNSLWVFPMATSCCGIELMAAAASRVDLDRMGTIVRATPRQADVMVIAGTITVKMAPRVRLLWDQMPEPKWAVAMGSCAISGDFYRNLYSVVPGIDTVVPVDVYVPGCPPNPEALMHGLLRLQEKIRSRRPGAPRHREHEAPIDQTRPSVARLLDPARDPEITARQEHAALEATSLESIDPVCAVDVRPPIAEAAAPGDGAGAADFESLLRDELGVTELPKDAPPMIAPAQHVGLARRLRGLGYSQLVTIVATHFPSKAGPKPQPERFEVAYGVRAPGPRSRLALWRLELAPGEAAPSLTGVYAGADWQEREQFDLVGVRFDGHPDMRRILMPDAWVGHPLRKDYASDTGCPPWR